MDVQLRDARDRLVFWLGLATLGLPFLGPFIVVRYPLPTHEGDLGASLVNGVEPLASLWFAVVISLALTVNFVVFINRRNRLAHRLLRRSVAVAQVMLIVAIIAWVVTQWLNVTVFGRETWAYWLIWFEAAASITLCVVVCVKLANDQPVAAATNLQTTSGTENPDPIVL